MNMYEIIEEKKLSKNLSKEEIDYFIKGYTNGEIPDYQVSALLMAIYFNGLNTEETYYLTDAMVNSGDRIDLSAIDGIKVDKHSTGGVGDTTTLVVGPLVASCGVPFAKMSGRGLGHTGGTIDKLESIPGMNIDLSIAEFIENANAIKIAICGQTGDITPADKKLYALRDATATVDNVSLISSSILSKKIAVGADALILDVKTGSGAFMKTLEEARELSKMMVDLGHKFNRKTVALITNMDEPLGYAVGNALEVIEAINTLRGEGPRDLIELCLNLSSKLLVLSGKFNSEIEARKLLNENISAGLGLEKFKEFVSMQGGDISYINDLSKFELSSIKREIYSNSEGYVKKIDALEIGEVSKNLGAGRETKDSSIDLGAGILLNKKIDDFVKVGDLLATVYTEKESEIERAKNTILSAYKIGEENKDEYKLVLDEID
ncbi:pyrimidine-nucleoside phosphorylase [Anaerosphaera aminiphila DSM 21120]|uniref:Pyrimidine-nucleoside phosphorylase n=1 Tax=Anaerosphaera aminiphila DSM 21120 TaxID=1120995 RepID=A0A1M5P8T6_9FIRM|nr:pyrimidine-nucleoside phosphorylase [Anaerosphaera aminiphila]SHG98127.1 pyrimidine-nucleoside phosphorylase [Anaerosphaera aminiphila DSM 21120]